MDKTGRSEAHRSELSTMRSTAAEIGVDGEGALQ